jgi:phosphatase NudJ
MDCLFGAGHDRSMRKTLRCRIFVLGVEHAGKLLVVRERKYGQAWYLPAGGLELGESIAEALVRETKEEAGVLVRPKGLVRVEEMWSRDDEGPFGWYRYILLAEPVGDPTPKSTPDEHSLEARWIHPEERSSLVWRGGGAEIADLFRCALARPPLAAIMTV